MAITERDIEVVLALYKYRYLSGSQIRTLLFPSVQTANRRLRVLIADGYVVPFRVPGIAERLFALNRKGAELVASQLGVSLGDLRWKPQTRQPKDYLFAKHFLAVNDFRIALTQACRDSNEIRLVGYIPEYFGEKSSQGTISKYIRDFVWDMSSPRDKVQHTCDSVFALEKQGKAALFFLEIDRGTEVVSDPNRGFLKSVRFYLNYLVAGKYRRYEDDFQREFPVFRVLYVTTSQDRLNNMRKAATSLPFSPVHAKRFLWLTTLANVTKQTILERIWVSADTADQRLYGIE